MSSQTGWYYVKAGKTVGPVTRDELMRALPGLQGPSTLVWGPGAPEWVEARHIAGLSAADNVPPPSPTCQRADDIDYEIYGDDMQFIEITLDPQEMVIAEAGSMMYMTQGIQMQTVFGDPGKQQGFLGKLFDAGKRMITGESLFLTTFGAGGAARERVAFAAPYPGKIVPFDLRVMGGEMICQKDAFLCAARGVHVGIALQKRILTGLFGGEGFILQRLTGDGWAFIHAGGTIQRLELAAGQTLRLDTGCLVALQPSVTYDIQVARGIKNAIFGGEGLFLATLTGPGLVWVQSLPFAKLAGRVLSNARGLSKKDQSSLVPGLFSLFEGGD